MPRYIHQKNIQFKNFVNRNDRSRILGVSIDPAKVFHTALIFNFTGKIIYKAFPIDLLMTGYDELVYKITTAQNRINALDTYIAIEGPDTFSSNFVNRLRQDYKNVVFVPPTAVAENRTQKSLRCLKSDKVDVAAIGDLLIRGEFRATRREFLIYQRLKLLIYWREKKVYIKSAIKNSIKKRMDKIYPGINCNFNGHKKLYCKTFVDKLELGLIYSNLTPHELLEIENDDLMKMFGYKMPSCGPSQIRKLKLRLNEMVLPDKKMARLELECLEKDVKILDFLNQEIEEVEGEIVRLGKMTPAKYIMGQIKGISELYASMYIGLIGDINNYKNASQIYSKSGLSPTVSSSGYAKKGHARINKRGNKLLRSVLFRMACTVLVCDPVFNDYFHYIKEKHEGRCWKKHRIAICRKLNKVLYALMRDKTEFRRLATGSSS